jgi:hypothetical protein
VAGLGLGQPFVMRSDPSLKVPIDRYCSSQGVTTRGTESGSEIRGGIDMTPLLYDSNDCCRDKLGLAGWLWRKLSLGNGGMSRVELERVATPGFCSTDRRRTGIYSEMSEFERVMGALGAFAGFELFHVVSVTTVCSSPDSSAKFNKRFASYDIRL